MQPKDLKVRKTPINIMSVKSVDHRLYKYLIYKF